MKVPIGEIRIRAGALPIRMDVPAHSYGFGRSLAMGKECLICLKAK